MSIELSKRQKRAIDKISDWVSDGDEQTLSLGGYAGTGKTTLIKYLDEYDDRVAIVSFTGKAVSVLHQKGVKRATTLHHLIYRPCGEDDEGDVVFTTKGHIGPVELVIVDEASMISKRLHDDLENVANKILYIGDHGQLEPIGYDPGIMRNPDFRLERIHRQAKGSEIIRYAHHVREEGHPMEWDGSVDVETRKWWPQDDIHTFDAVLCGYNRTRHHANRQIREARGYTSDIPEVGETLICLYNNRQWGVHNGLQVVVTGVRSHDDPDGLWISYTDYEGRGCEVPIYVPQLGVSEKFEREEQVREDFTLFDWGYALTVHKSQGSEWDSVCVIHETGSWNMPRWSYTAATRAAKKLTYIVRDR